jgi:hypothetical protein
MPIVPRLRNPVLEFRTEEELVEEEGGRQRSSETGT